MTEVLNAGPKASAGAAGSATDFAPYVPPGVSPPEITLRAIVIASRRNARGSPMS